MNKVLARFSMSTALVTLLLSNVLLTHAQLSISLSDAIQIGLNKNYDVIIIKDEGTIASNNNRIGEAGFLPSISLNASNNNRFADVDNPASFLNDKFRIITYTPSIQLNWTVFDGFRAHITKNRLALLEEQSAGNVAVVIENTIQAIILAYNRALVQKESMEVLQEILDLSRVRYDYILYQKELGTASTFEMLQVKNAYYSDSSTWSLQATRYRNSIRDLNLLLSLDINTELTLTDELKADFQTYKDSILLREMVSNNETLKNQYINQTLMRKDVKLQQANLYPTIGFETSASYAVTNFKLQDSDALTGNQFDYFFNFSLNFNLFNGGNNLRSIKNAKIREEIAFTTTEQMKLMLSSQLYNALESYNSRIQLLGLDRTLVQDARLNLELAEDKFRSGVLTSFDYRDTQFAYRQARLRLLENIASLSELDTELLRLTGGLIQDLN